MKTSICIDCKKERLIPSNRIAIRCRRCSNILKAHLPKKLENIIASAKLRKGENHPNWKGSGASYQAFHIWARAWIPKPKVCSFCRKDKKLDVANISQKYRREISDWEWLCRKCHMKQDGRTTRRNSDGTFKTNKTRVVNKGHWNPQMKEILNS